MRNYKYLMAQFTFYDRTGICRLLEQQAEKGWVLDKVTNYAWRLRRMEPKKLHYAVAYFPKASAYDPHPSEAQRELQEFCAHSGWILAGTMAQMQIFYNESENPVPIETDPMVELENIHKSAKKSYLPAYFMLLGLAIFQIVLQVGQLISFPLTYLSQNTTLFNWLCQGVLLVMCATEIGGYFSWYRKAKAAAENGEFVQTRGSRKFQLTLLGIVVAALILLLISMKPRLATMMILTLVLMFGAIGGTMGLHMWMKKKGVSRNTNRIVTWTSSIAFALVVCALSMTVMADIFDLPVWAENREVRQFEWNGQYFDIYNDDIPLRVEDLTDAQSPDYSYEAREQGSPFLKKGDYSQRIWASSELPEMSYIVYTTRIPAVYDLVVREVTKPMEYPYGVYENGEPFYDEYIPQDGTLWGADLAYRRYAGGESDNHWVLCYDGSVVIFQPNWELTPDQMAAVGDLFRK